MLILNKGGKKIDLNHSQKQSIVGSHLINLNSDNPTNLEKGTVDGKLVFQDRVNSVQGGVKTTESHF